MRKTGEASPARRAAVLGSPIAHSLSPVLHTAAYAALGLAPPLDQMRTAGQTELARRVSLPSR